MTDEAVETVVVSAEETPDETVIVNEGDTTVIVETPNESEETQESFEEGVTVGQLLERVSRLEVAVFDAQVTAEIAQETAEVAIAESVAAEDVAEDVGEAVDTVSETLVEADGTPDDVKEELGEEVEDTSDSILPTKKHFVHRTWRELIGR